MSALAISFDSTFNMGPQSGFSWPASLESSPSQRGYLSPDFAAFDSGSDVGLASPSLSSSNCPSPRPSFTIQQREIKRQRDRVRRDSRIATRVRRVNSQPSSYMGDPSMTLSDTTGSLEMPTFYSTAAPPMTLLTEPYMPPYSPPLDPSQTHMFPTPYGQSMQQPYGMPMEYHTSPYIPSISYSSRISSLSHEHQETGMMYQMPAVMASTVSSSSNTTVSTKGGQVRVVQSRPKPRCWEHGCNGRQFSTFSNLLRHQREKSGQATKSSCPNCGAEFTRTTARNGHMLHDKCKQRKSC